MIPSPSWWQMPQRAVRLPRLALACSVWLAAVGLPCVAGAAGHLALGLERLSFHDEQLADIYGARIGPTAAGNLLERSWMDLGLRASYISGEDAAPHLAFITGARTEMTIVPVRLQGRLHRALGSAFEVWGGPQIAWAGFRESWEVDVPAAGVAARQQESGSWLGLGGIAGLRVRTGGLGHLRASIEWVWADADRVAVPGNSKQESGMDGGWSGFALLWEPRWLEF